MHEMSMPAADPFAEPTALGAQTVQHLKDKYAVPADAEAVAAMPIDVALIERLSGDKILHRFLRNAVHPDPAFDAFLARLRRVLFFGEWSETDREELPIGLMASVVHQCIRNGYALPYDEEEASWVKLLRKALNGADWKAPAMERQVQLLRLALYVPLKGLPFETSLLLVRPDHWDEQIGILIDDVLRGELMGA